MNMVRFLTVLFILMASTISIYNHHAIFGALLFLISLVACFSGRIKFKKEDELLELIESNFGNKHKDTTVSLDKYLKSGYFINKTDEIVMFIEIDQKNSLISLERYNFNDILSVDLIVDEVTIVETSPGVSIGSAIVGGLLAGGVGAVIGATSNHKSTQKKNIKEIKLRVGLNDLETPYIDLVLFKKISSDITTETIKNIDMAFFKFKLILASTTKSKNRNSGKKYFDIKIPHETMSNKKFLSERLCILLSSLLLCSLLYFLMSKNVQSQSKTSPTIACEYLSNLPFLNKPSGYEEIIAGTGNYMCGTPYSVITSPDGDNNVIAYYVSGSKSKVYTMMIEVDINNANKNMIEKSMELYWKASIELLNKNLNFKSISNGSILADIRKNNQGNWQLGDLDISSTKEIWSTGLGYDYKFIIKKHNL